MIDFSDFRRLFSADEKILDIEDLSANPIIQCEKWFKDVQRLNLLDGNAMTLSTSNGSGQISSRIVLLKYFDPSKGFIFFTNYESRKARDIEKNSNVSANFYWPSLNRQICVRGTAQKLPHSESLSYYQKRPRLNQLMAWASNQDEVIVSTDILHQKIKQLESKYENQEIPYPPHWGGYSIKPNHIEFWQGGAGRLNIRFCYQKTKNQWSRNQLSP